MKTPSLLHWATAFLATAPSSVSALESVVRYPSAEQQHLNTVCWAGMQYVAAGDLGTVFTSPDGIAWTRRTVPGTPNIAGSAASAGRIVLGAPASNVLTSTDGITWSAATLPGPFAQFENVRHLAWNGAAFRAVSAGGANWDSADGLSWTRLTTGFASSKLAVNGSAFVAWPFSPGGGVQELFTDSGSGWNTIPTDLSQPMRHLVWNGVRYISVGPSGAAATSTDGTAWTPRTTGVTATLEQIIWTGSLAVAIGAGGTIITSPNGATWTSRTSGTTADLTSLVAGSGSMIAVGKGGVILRSPDGIAWSVIRASNQAVNVTGIDWTGTGLVAVANPHATLTSPDGITWTRTASTTGPTGAGLRLAPGAGKLVAADGASGLWTAPTDASSWTNGAQANALGTASVWDGQQFVSLCQAWDSRLSHWNFYITRSSDGMAWTPLSQIRFGSNDLGTPQDDLLFTGSRYLSSQRQSTDSTTWTNSAVPDFTRFLVSAGSGYLAISGTGSIHTSPDGVAWTPSVPAPFSGQGPPVRGVIWTGYRLLAAQIADNGIQGVWDGGPGRPWTKIHPVGGISIAWTGTRALVSSGIDYGPAHLFSLENVDASLPPTWGYWQQSYFSPAQVADPLISGPLADGDGDGYSNVVEFMAGSSPVSATDRPWITALPPQGGQGSRFQWHQETGRNGVTVRAEVSTDLDLWDTLAYAPIDGSPGGLRTMQATAPASLGKAFFRLYVTLNE